MSKSYYQSPTLLIPFTKVESIWTSSDGTYLDVYTPSNSYKLSGSANSNFLTQYTAWLDSQSIPSL